MNNQYTISRKYGLPNFTNFDITLQTPTENPVEALLKADKIADEYYAELEKKNAVDDLPSKTYRIGNEWFTLNRKEDKLYKQAPKEKQINKDEEPKKTLPF